MNIFFRFVGGFIVGVLCSLYSLQFNTQFIETVYDFFKKEFEKNFVCKASFKLNTVNIPALKIQAHNIQVTSSDSSSWYWHAKNILLMNYWPWLLKQKVGLQIYIQNMQAFSFIDNNYLLIFDHLKKLMIDTQDIPVALKCLRLEDILFKAQTKDASCIFFAKLFGYMDMHAHALHMKLAMHEGECILYNTQLLHDLNFIARTRKDHVHKNWDINAEGSFFSLIKENLQEYFFHLSSSNNDLHVDLHNKDHDTHIHIQQLDEIFNLQAQGNLENIPHFYKKYMENILQGNFSVFGKYNVNSRTGTIHFNAENVHNNHFSLYKINAQADIDNDLLQAQANIYLWPHVLLNANIQINKRGEAEIICTNPDDLIYSKNFFISSNAFKLKIHINNDQYMHLEFNIVMHMYDKSYQLNACMEYDKFSHQFILSGSMHDFSFKGKLCMKDLAFTHIEINWKDKKIIQLDEVESQQLEGIIEFSTLKKLLQELNIIELRGGTPISLNIKKNNNKIYINVVFQDAHVQIPGTYNFIQDCSVTLVVDNLYKKLKIKDLKVHLHKGLMTIKRGVIRYHDRYIHLPVKFEDVFFNKTQEIMGFVSGSLLMQNYVDSLTCIGSLVIDQGSCKYVDFSSWFKGSLGMSFLRAGNISIPIKSQIVIKTKSPLIIDVPFIQAQCVADMLIDSYLHDINILGKVDLISGSLHFPYRSLYITHGKILFLPQQLNDPIIELVARGRIRKYQIIMRISGSVQQPDIHLESIPSLQDEQIITLLLSGSDKGSFAFAMPSVLLHNAHKWVFSKKSINNNSSKFEYYIRGFLEPFRHIRIIPSFIDQTSRGGFRGAIEITVSERLRALIQKNFSLTEDTKLEVEYALTDDITLRAIRDERGDLGGEVEMRWKF